MARWKGSPGRRLGFIFLVFLALIAFAESRLVVRFDFPIRSGAKEWDDVESPTLESAAAVLFDIDRRFLLYAHNAHQRFPPGELVKIVAAGLALEQAEWNDVARVTRNASRAEGLSLNIREGEEFPLGVLITRMMYRPGGDAAVAVAEHVSGSVQLFAETMNQLARDLGAERTRFTNSHGVDDERQRSSAYDLALLSLWALEHDAFSALVANRRASIPWRGRRLRVVNHNSFLWRDPHANGIKSSYTPEAGHSAVVSASKDGRNLLAVVLGAPSARSRWEDVKTLLDFGFAWYEQLRQNPAIERVRYEVQPGDTLFDLADRFDVPISVILRMNELTNPDTLKSGDELWIPR